MRSRIFKFVSICVVLAVTLAVSHVAITPQAIGETITASQMANMFGGGFACPDKDCDTQVAGCPGGSTCEPEQTDGYCRQCLTGNGTVCGQWQQSWGWMCVNGTEGCNSSKGICVQGFCDPRANNEPTPDCATKPDCS